LSHKSTSRRFEEKKETPIEVISAASFWRLTQRPVGHFLDHSPERRRAQHGKNKHCDPHDGHRGMREKKR